MVQEWKAGTRDVSDYRQYNFIFTSCAIQVLIFFLKLMLRAQIFKCQCHSGCQSRTNSLHLRLFRYQTPIPVQCCGHWPEFPSLAAVSMSVCGCRYLCCSIPKYRPDDLSISRSPHQPRCSARCSGTPSCTEYTLAIRHGLVDVASSKYSFQPASSFLDNHFPDVFL